MDVSDIENFFKRFKEVRKLSNSRSFNYPLSLMTGKIVKLSHAFNNQRVGAIAGVITLQAGAAATSAFFTNSNPFVGLFAAAAAGIAVTAANSYAIARYIMTHDYVQDMVNMWMDVKKTSLMLYEFRTT